MTEKYILAIDQGTTGTKVLLVNEKAQIIESAYRTHKQYYPQPSWIEHHPKEIWDALLEAVQEVMSKSNIQSSDIKSVGIANQGETCLAWQNDTGEPLYPAIVWSCLRTEDIVSEWEKKGTWKQRIYDKTGLHIDSYFSATKFKWLMDNVKDVNEQLAKGNATIATLDAWLIYKMTGGKSYVTDASTASRTLLYNIHDEKWDEEIIKYLNIKESYLPKILNTMDNFGRTDPAVFCGIDAPVQVSLVDQPAALYGHLCLQKGEIKTTYGTGCFAYLNAGQSPLLNKDSTLLSSVTWKKDGESTFSLDGSVYSAGAAIEWGKNSLGFYESIDELQKWSIEWFENEVFHSDVKFIPSLSGIGAPYWNSEARGMFIGMNTKTNKKDMAKSILEGIAHRVADVIEELQKESGEKVKFLKVDGKLTANPYLMQYQANLLNIPVRVSQTIETTGLGVAYLAGEYLGWWTSEELVNSTNNQQTVYTPKIRSKENKQMRNEWKKLIAAIDNLYT
ncbi:glycerol kinase [Oceanobacillus sojae]|uniref:FGGY-family carbohydrate kinase n=1 Tax=Oceanobacillus sojae TaxID=582851 RepID=UPI0021A84822|nr:glycerol kinase [Oceanobacillus sojae]MCT1901489.1 glycerol kinase GlpK [Oceanobacillus sojae]